jgi:DNA topoisomerase-1
LPRLVGAHPETGNPITASIGRYGPYLAHDGKYAKLATSAEVLEIGMNAAVARLADAANAGPARGSREPLRVLGAHPRTEAQIRLMQGRFGPYVTDGTTNATLPKTLDMDQLSLEEAAQLIDERAAKGPAKKGGRRRSQSAGAKGNTRRKGKK